MQTPDWQELGTAWRELGEQWVHFWLPGIAPLSDQAAPAQRAGDKNESGYKSDKSNGLAMLPGLLPTWAGMPAPEGVDLRVWQELCARYQSRMAELWSRVAQRQPGDRGEPVVEAPEGDRRFRGAEWNEYPFFDLVKQAYLINAQFWQEAAERLAPNEEARKKLAFFVRQYVDALAPSNFVATNPEVIRLALATEGKSIAQGLSNLVEDLQKGRIAMTDERAFAVGKNLAITPGAVIFRNDLIEVIQYTPSTAKVYARPLVIIPPCINKYYILDLQPDNSFVRYAVEQGHTVFIVSWRNIPQSLANLGFDDYLTQGVFPAIEIAKAVSGSKTVNALGFCVGGALLACALAVMAAKGDKSVASVTLLTTMLDYAEPGEIGVYVDETYLKAREPVLMSGGRVAGAELATAFASLRANELVWFFVVNNYLKGKTPAAFDLLFWNGDSANLPGPMYAFYLRKMYLENKLREPGGISVCGTPVDLGRVRQPAFVLAAREDHIVPWHAAYRSAQLLGGEVDFVLAASGHIAGVINPAAKNKRSFWHHDGLAADPERWDEQAVENAGSWWPRWSEWLAQRGGRLRTAPKLLGNAQYKPLIAAPGTYVTERPD